MKDKFNLLSQNLNKNREETAILKRDLIGLTAIVQKRTDSVNQAFLKMSENLQSIEEQLNHHYKLYQNMTYSSKLKRIMSAKFNDIVISSIIEIYNLMLFGSTIEDLEEALIRMRRGLLPSNIITPDYLKNILKLVGEKISFI